jgi:hypothetical protein
MIAIQEHGTIAAQKPPPTKNSLNFPKFVTLKEKWKTRGCFSYLI